MNRIAEKALLGCWAAREVIRHGLPSLTLGFLGGIGDDLLCTAPIHEWLNRGAQKIWFVSRFPELYGRLSSRVSIVPEDPRYRTLAARLGAPFHALSYSEYDQDTDRDIPPTEHLIAVMCRRAGLAGRVQLRPRLQLSNDERNGAAHYSGVIALQSGGLGATVPMRNKQWRHERFQAVADTLTKMGQKVVQVGSSVDHLIVGARDLRGALKLRETAALLSSARMFVGTSGFLMHLARAVECPAVIVYGGREAPALTGYSCNENIWTTPECSPCWQRNRCDHGNDCMQSIGQEHVLDGVRKVLQRDRRALSVDEVTL